jgi:hypothetical protein
VLRASTHNYNSAEGGNQYAGNDYLARVDSHDIAQIQARSAQGVDRISDVTIHLYNADQYVYLNYEAAAGKGFKGAILKLAIVLMDIDPSTGLYTFSTDSPAPTKFQGICEAPQGSDGGAQTLSIRATTSHNLAKVDFPIVHVQQRCVNYFPANAAQRLAGATDISSWWWSCGYNPDQAGTDPEIGGDCRRGNTTTPYATDALGNVIADGAGIYISCGYTKADCQVRGMYTSDSSSRATGRFTAIQWAPLNRVQQSKQYSSGKWVTVLSGRNDSIYTRSYPMLYGNQWVKQPIVANVLGDANSTRCEVVLCVGDIGPDGIVEVVVNGVIVPPLGSASPLLGTGPDPLFRWNFLDQLTTTSTHTGSRNGRVNGDLGWNGQGDPYGGLATIEIVVYADLAQSGAAPSVQIWGKGPRIVKYAPIASYNNGVITLPAGAANVDIAGNSPFTVQVLGNSLAAANGVFHLSTWSYGPPGTVTLSGGPSGTGTGGYIRYLARTNNPAWVLFDALVWGNYSFPELDVDSVIAAAAICDVPVNYLDLNGNTATHARFIAEFSVEDRRKGNELVASLLRSFRAQLIPNSETGLTQVFIRQTLADQHPSPIAGSNYNTAVASITAAGAAANGYVAYLIDESVILQDGNGKPSIRGPYSLANAQAANQVSFPFQDADNQYADDSIQVADPDDVARAAGYQLGGQAIDAGLAVVGVSSFDQGIRIANVIIAEALRGNESRDTRGTRLWDVTTTHRLEHLKVGQIVLFRYQALQLQPAVPLQSPSGTNITGILCRVDAIQPTTDYRRMTVTLRWHDDYWYTDSYGQKAAPPYSEPGTVLPTRPPYPWKPYGEQPVSGDSMWAASEWNFALAQSYPSAANGWALASLTVAGNPPLNQPIGTAQPPLMARQGATANTGGSIPGGSRVYGAIAVQDAAGNWSVLSKLFSVDIPAGTDTNAVTTPAIAWQTGTVSWALFAGADELRMCFQSSGSATPSTISITALQIASYGAPDPLADSLVFRVKRIFHGGVWGDECTAVASNGDGTGTITFATATTTHQFQQIDSTHGYDLTLLAKPLGDAGNVPIADFHVIDNTGGVYHVSPDPVAVGLSTSGGYVFEMRALPTVVTSTTIGDPNFVNAYAAAGFGGAGNEEANRLIRIVRGRGRGQVRRVASNNATTLTIEKAWDTTPDTTSRFIIEEQAWQPELTAKESSAALTSSPAPTVASLSIDNYRQQTILVEALVADPNGNTSLRRWSPMREIYVWGAQGTVYLPNPQYPGNSYTIQPTDSLIVVDCSVNGAPFVVTNPVFSSVPNQTFQVAKKDSTAYTVTDQCQAGDTYDDGSTSTVLYNRGDSTTFRVHG